MPENQLFDAVANLILQSVSVWEDMHLYAMAYSAEYNAFWGLLDSNLKATIRRHQNRNLEERLIPFTVSHIHYYKALLTPESFDRTKGQHWKRQLKIIITDQRFRTVMTNLNDELKSGYKSTYRQPEHRPTAAPVISEGTLRISTHVVCANAAALYNYVR